MKKILVALLLLVATPAQAQQQVFLSVTAERYQELVYMAPDVCKVARTLPGNMGENIDRLVQLDTPSEKLLMLAMCRTYLFGVLHTLRKGV